MYYSHWIPLVNPPWLWVVTVTTILLQKHGAFVWLWSLSKLSFNGTGDGALVSQQAHGLCFADAKSNRLTHYLTGTRLWTWPSCKSPWRLDTGNSLEVLSDWSSHRARAGLSGFKRFQQWTSFHWTLKVQWSNQHCFLSLLGLLSGATWGHQVPTFGAWVSYFWPKCSGDVLEFYWKYGEKLKRKKGWCVVSTALGIGMKLGTVEAINIGFRWIVQFLLRSKKEHGISKFIHQYDVLVRFSSRTGHQNSNQQFLLVVLLFPLTKNFGKSPWVRGHVMFFSDHLYNLRFCWFAMFSFFFIHLGHTLKLFSPIA